MVGSVDGPEEEGSKLNLKREDFEGVDDAKIQSETQKRGRKGNVTCVASCRLGYRGSSEKVDIVNGDVKACCMSD